MLLKMSVFGRHKVNWFAGSASYLALGAALAIAGAPQKSLAQAAPDQGGGAQLEEVVVTAQKKEENLQVVPVAVTALSRADIEAHQVQSFVDLTGLAPNVTALTSTSGSNPVVSIRGIVGSSQANGQDSSVAMYIDGVYLSRSVGAGLEVADLDRVEVLRGPQGTLYGRNSTGGAINFVTSAPKGEFYVRQDVTVGNLGELRTKTRLDLPTHNGLSFSASFLHDEMDGFVRNTQAGTTWNFSGAMRGLMTGNRTSPSELGGHNTEAGRVAIRYEPASAAFRLDYRFDYTQQTSVQTAEQVIGFAPGAGGGFSQQIYAAQPFVGGGGVISLSRLDAVPNGFTTPEHLNAWGHSFTASWDISNQLQFKNIVAIRGFRDEYSNDIGGDGSLLDPSGSGLPFRILAITAYERDRQYSEEAQLNYRSKLVDAVGGIYWFRDDTLSKTPTFAFTALPSAVPAGLAAVDSDATSHNRSLAGYGQVTVHLTDKLDVTGGARYTKDRRETEGRTLINGVPFGTVAKTFNHTDWTANITYRPTLDNTLYVKAGSGYLSGGVFNGVPFLPEEVKQYEIGSKNEFFDRRVRLNLAAFHSDYTNLQQINSSLGYAIVANAGSAKINGAEVELDLAPIQHLTLNANYGFTDLQYDQFLLNGVDITDQATAHFVPRHTVTFGGAYDFPELPQGARPSLRVDARWHSDTHLLPLKTYTPAIESVVADNPYWNVDARFTVEHIALQRVYGKFSIWARNLLDERKIVNATDLGTVITAQYNQPRTFGVDLSVEF